jgi:hypothetical protein
VELLEKFRIVQERARRASRSNSIFGGVQADFERGYSDEQPKEKNGIAGQNSDGRGIARAATPTGGRGGLIGGSAAGPSGTRPSKVGLGLSRFSGGVGGKKGKK